MVEATSPSETVNLNSTRERLDEIVDRVRRSGDRVVIEADGKAAAVLVSVGDFRRLQQLDVRRERAFEGMQKISEAFADVPLPELERQVELALADVRAETRAERENAASR